MNAVANFVQTFNGTNTTSNPITSTINTANILTAVKSNIGSVLTPAIQPTGSTVFYTQPSTITGQS
jgi:hypothetical protein